MILPAQRCRHFVRFLYQIKSCRHHYTSSANPTEIAHFDKLASTWWAPHGPSRLLHEMNPLRHEFVKICISSFPGSDPPRERRYLDVGCGGGIFAESAARLLETESVLAIDPSSEVIKVAKRHAQRDPILQQSDRLSYENISIEDMPAPRSIGDQFDILTLFEVIEHVSQPGPFLERCLPHIKPGGWLILSTIARSWVSWLTTKVVAEDIIGLVPQGTHDWEKYINEEELRSFFLKKAGWAGEGGLKSQGVLYAPGLSWKVIPGGEKYGNYFFGVRKNLTE